MGTNFDFMMDCDINFMNMFEELERAPKDIKKELRKDMREAGKETGFPDYPWTPTPEDRRP